MDISSGVLSIETNSAISEVSGLSSISLSLAVRSGGSGFLRILKMKGICCASLENKLLFSDGSCVAYLWIINTQELGF